jgi:hypothetical protein
MSCLGADPEERTDGERMLLRMTSLSAQDYFLNSYL